MPDLSDKKPVIVVTGPTATGKTALGVALAEFLETEVISADSQLVYRELTIGTAKPTEEEMRGIPHRMMDMVGPTEAYSVAQYQQAAREHLDRLHAEGKIPVVVGGTGFYIRALLESSFLPDVPPDEAFRRRMTAIAEAQGSEALHRLLREKDPQRAAALHPNDRVRVIRALEIIEQTGQPVPNANVPHLYRLLWFGLMFEDRDRLRTRIDQRIDAMIEAGWLAEVQGLIARYGPDAHALGVAHGYPEWVKHLQGEMSYAEALAQIQINIHQYARRQLTWFRPNPDIHWFRLDETTPDACVAQSKALIETTFLRP